MQPGSCICYKAYEKFVSIPHHPKIATMFGLCPNTGCIVLELCEKQIGDHKIHTLENLMSMYGDEIPMDLKILAMTDITMYVKLISLAHLHAQKIPKLNHVIPWYWNHQWNHSALVVL